MSITNFSSLRHLFFFSFFFFNDPAPTEIYTLSLHDALPISMRDIGAEALVVLEPRSHRHAQRPLGCRNHLQIGRAVVARSRGVERRAAHRLALERPPHGDDRTSERP